jgi:Protein of unknown function (DUF2924)
MASDNNGSAVLGSSASFPLDVRFDFLISAFLAPLQAGRHVKVGSVIVREYQGKLHEVLVVPGGFCWQEQVFASLSTIARKITGTSWNGPRFFGLRDWGKTKGDLSNQC